MPMAITGVLRQLWQLRRGSCGRCSRCGYGVGNRIGNKAIQNIGWFRVNTHTSLCMLCSSTKSNVNKVGIVVVDSKPLVSQLERRMT